MHLTAEIVTICLRNIIPYSPEKIYPNAFSYAKIKRSKC